MEIKKNTSKAISFKLDLLNQLATYLSSKYNISYMKIFNKLLTIFWQILDRQGLQQESIHEMPDLWFYVTIRDICNQLQKEHLIKNKNNKAIINDFLDICNICKNHYIQETE